MTAKDAEIVEFFASSAVKKTRSIMFTATWPHCEYVNRYDVNKQSYKLEKTYRTEQETVSYTYPPHDTDELTCSTCKRTYWAVFLDQRW